MIDNMKTVNLDISEATYRDLERLGQLEDREPTELMRDAIERYRAERIAAQAAPQKSKILSRKPLDVGAILVPWTSRAEMLDDYFDRD
jgi:hypothetical protein